MGVWDGKENNLTLYRNKERFRLTDIKSGVN